MKTISEALATLAEGCTTAQEVGAKLAAQGIRENSATRYACGCPIAVYLEREHGEKVVTVHVWSQRLDEYQRGESPVVDYHPGVIVDFICDYDMGKDHFLATLGFDPYAALRRTEEERQSRPR